MSIHIPRQIELVPVTAIKSNPRNARIHSPAQRALLARNFSEFGFLSIVVLDDDNVLVSGHLRVEAAREAGLVEVPAIRTSHLSPAQRRAFAIADNQLAALSEWNFEILAEEFSDLLVAEIDFDLAITGFEAPRIDAIVHGEDFAVADAADAVLPDVQAGPALSQPGEVWEIGEHRLIVGDSRWAGVLGDLLGSQQAQLVVADPPFNVRINGHVSGKGRVRHREFEMGSGEMSRENFERFNHDWMANAARFSADGSLLYAFMDGRHLGELLNGARAAGFQLQTVCVWAKTNGGMGSLYRSQVEHVPVFRAGQGAHVNNVQLGRHGRSRTTLWSYPGMNSFGRSRDAALKLHPTVKPVGLLADIVLDASRRGDVVLDPFLGSGSTIIAAHRTGRRGYGVELDPRYVDATLDRLAAVLGDDPVRASDGVCWSARRAADEAHA